MNIKALITTFVLGSSSVAMAEPVFSASANASWSWGTPSPRVEYRGDHRDVYSRDHRDVYSRDHRDSRDHRRPWEYDRRDYPVSTYPGGWAPRMPYRAPYQQTCHDPLNIRIVNSTTSEYTGPIRSMPRDRSYYQYRQGWFAMTDPT